MLSPEYRPISLRNQQGFSLVMTILLLLILMTIGLGAMNTSDTGFRAAGNLQFQSSAMDRAQYALAQAEWWLISGTNAKNPAFFTTPTKELYPINLSRNPLNLKWDDQDSIQVDGSNSQRYIIELFATNKPLAGSGLGVTTQVAKTTCNVVNIFRITSRGESIRGATKFLQTLYSVPGC
jgi:Tfp pilus assembly protein PilX